MRIVKTQEQQEQKTEQQKKEEWQLSRGIIRNFDVRTSVNGYISGLSITAKSDRDAAEQAMKICHDYDFKIESLTELTKAYGKPVLELDVKPLKALEKTEEPISGRVRLVPLEKLSSADIKNALSQYSTGFAKTPEQQKQQEQKREHKISQGMSL